jgi:hypothetical protein
MAARVHGTKGQNPGGENDGPRGFALTAVAVRTGDSLVSFNDAAALRRVYGCPPHGPPLQYKLDT